MKKIFPILLLILVMLVGCNSDTVDTPLYNGKSLVIGVIGVAPKVREDHVKFTTISFDELEEDKELSSEFDAIFITKEHLTEAAESKYAEVYINAGIPFFFIESKKSYVPFIDKEISYEGFPDVNSGEYAVSYYQSGEKGQVWGYGLYNDKVNESNIKDAYSRMFSTIESINNLEQKPL